MHQCCQSFKDAVDNEQAEIFLPSCFPNRFFFFTECQHGSVLQSLGSFYLCDYTRNITKSLFPANNER